MSLVSNVILAYASEEDVSARLDDVNRYFLDRGERGFVNTWVEGFDDRFVGGSKHLDVPTFLGAFNNLDVERFLAHLAAVSWEEPDCVQVFLKEQDAERYRVAYDGGPVR